MGLSADGSFSMGLFSSHGDIRDVTWQFTEDNLDLFHVMNVVDCDQWSTGSYIPGCIAYASAEDLFLCLPGDALRSCPGMTQLDCPAAAGTFRLSQGQKAACGID